MKKKGGLLLAAALVILAVLLLVFAPSGRETNYENLLGNGDFEAGSSAWAQDAYVITQGYTAFEVRPGEGRNGTQALYIRNDYPNDARYLQEVEVESDALYHLHGYVRADAEQGWGGNLSVDGVYVFSDQVFDSKSEWQEVSLYGKTGKDQKYLTVFVRLGGYSGESVGEAWFDDVTLTRVDKVPEGYYAQNLFKEETYVEEASGEGKPANFSLILSALVYLIIFYGAVTYLTRRENREPDERKSAFVMLAILFAGLVLRLLLAVLIHGYDIDTNDFMLWAQRMEQEKPWGFYVSGGFCDYPPGALLILWVLGILGKWMGGMSVLLVKMPSILCDLFISLYMYRMAAHLTNSRKAGIVAALLCALNPLLLTAGAAWGQMDSVMVAVLLAVLFYALQGKWRAALPAYVIAVLIKPQALMFGPLGLAALITDFVRVYRLRDKEKINRVWMQFGQGMALLVLCALVIVVPFSVYQGGIGWLFELYGRTMSHYSQATVNSCNLYFLFGLNWVDVNSMSRLLLPLAGVAVLLVPALLFAFVRGQKMWFKAVCAAGGAVAVLLFAVIRAFGTLSYAQVGAVLMALSILIVMALYIRGRTVKHLPLLGSVLLTLLFTLGTMMHERYLVPAVAFLMLAYLVEKDKRILWLMAGVTVMCLFNVGAVLDRNMRIGGAAGHLSAPYFNINSDLKLLEYASAVMSLIVSMAAVYLALDLCRRDVSKRDKVQKLRAAASPEEKRSGHYEKSRLLPASRMDVKDYAIMGAVTVLFSVFTLTNLGSVKAPENAYVFTDPEEQIVLDLGAEKEFNLLYYGGIHWTDSNFTVEVSRDGVFWEGPYAAEMQDGDCFRWKYLVDTYGVEKITFTKDPLQLSARYVRITADHVGLTLHEVVARDQNGDPIAMTVYEGAPDAQALCDEKDTLVGEPGWFNSTYFDEIYHARTAYEHLHGLRTYEWTHPPLGKVLMSWGIAVFGMTPFGWRFAGAVMGILMLPGMYLLGKLLFKKRWCAVMPMALMALDFMHFTQTRIATIDSFVVCFIIWAVYFMLRYLALDFWKTKYIKTFVPLALSGLFMALSVASKWTGCYAGVGLALLFFYSVWRRMRYVQQLKKANPASLTDDERQIAEQGYRKILLNVLSCFLFFVAVPLLVYYCSYIPFGKAVGGITVKRIIEECKRMLEYHGQPGLGMDHYFYSPWYEWPLAITPMWYASSSYEAAGMESTIMAFGNPAVWWVGAVSVLWTCALWCVRHVRRDGSIALHTLTPDVRPALLLLCFLAQYLPWMLVPRGTYIYHYFTAVPFVILCNTYVFAWLDERVRNLGKYLFAAQCAASLALLIAFFPYISGVEAPTRWLDAMKWFDGWLWY